ncbi:hypothetical protein H072_196 [Dactylellina haptotyla CBS 200.50]|uniref:WSC domain-containing protein n=1 Tax=Dactylellina haptotyla (strain CBS 200.50) TaxID=1284197 RepID=S8CDF8_DACHA|nr:hypothetical protein H072_196 [Dactylellina haptotyla CBS 200.50]
MWFSGTLLLAFIGFLPGLNAQSVQCATVADGCDAGGANEAAVASAIARFQDGLVYGGGDIVLSSAFSGDNLAMITYMCQDGGSPPKLEGSFIRSQFQKILSCTNRCGGVASPTNSNCGFGALIANNGKNIACLSKAVNVSPQGSAPQIVQSVGAYKSPKCFVDPNDNRVLTGGSQTDHSVTGMTVEKCIALAKAAGARYAGVEYGGECYWGATQNNAQSATLSDCNMPCDGNAAEVCGSGNRILIYDSGSGSATTTSSAAATPTINPGVSGFTYYGCYSDDVNNRALSERFEDASGMTIAECIAHAGSSYNFAGVEYGQECWYGNTLASSSSAQSAGCDKVCPGKATELCGGGNRIQLYKNPNYQPPGQPNIGSFISQGCYTDSVDARALEHSSNDASGMTIQKCVQLAAGFKYAGLEYHSECYWGNTLASSSTPADSGNCDTTCAGDSSQICGGGNRISVYRNTDYQEPVQANVNQGEAPWTLKGCYASNTLENSQTASDMTVDKCFDLAISYRYAAVQGGDTCYWGDDLASSATSKDISECSSACTGKADEICGGQARTIVYEDTSYELIDIDGMVALFEELSDNENALLGDLQLWTDLVAQAQADAESGNQKRWLVAAVWAARMIPVWNRMRNAAGAVNTLTRNIQRKAGVWKRRTTEAFQRVLPQRPNVANEYQMIEFNQVQNNAQAGQQAAGQVVRYEANQAVAAVGTAGGLALIGVNLLADLIDDLFSIIEWHRNEVQRYDPPPDSPPDDPDDPPEEPPLPGCGCGENGCINPQNVLKRAAHAYQESEEDKLSKRAQGETYSISMCNGLTYTARTYPSYGELVTIYNNQGLVPPHLDLQFQTVNGLPNPTRQCFWSLRQFNPPGNLFDPGVQYYAGYATEHTWENAFLRIFFEDMQRENCVTCEDATPVQQPGQPAPAPTPGMRQLFFQANNVAGSRYQNRAATEYLVDCLHWYHAQNNPNGWHEFFILENRINTNKRNILTPGNTVENTGTFQELLDAFIRRLGRVEAGFEYLNTPAVANVFMAVFNRLYAEFQNFDTDPYTSQFPPYQNTQTCGTPVNGQNVPYPGWAFAFHYWTYNLLANAEDKMQAWIAIAQANIRRKIRDEYPANTFPLSNTDFTNWMSYGANPTSNLGVLAANRFLFDRNLYGTLFN